MSSTFKHLVFGAVLVVLMIFGATTSGLLIGRTSADPAAVCGSGATLVPEDSQGNPSYCTCPSGSSLVTSDNSCQTSCPNGSSNEIDKSGGTYCNAATANTATGKCNTHSFFGLVPWYQYLGPDVLSTSNGGCQINCFNVLPLSTPKNGCSGTKSDVPLVLLAVVDDLLRVAGLVAIIYVIYGATQYVISQGSPDQTNKARQTIINALIGLGIAIIAVAFVSFLGDRLGG